MLWLIGTGLSSVDDLTIAGVKALRQCDFIFIDTYTSIMDNLAESVTEITGKEVHIADRDLVEQGDEILDKAYNNNVALLVVGDPLGATTHADILLRAVERDVKYKVIHNASIITSVGCCGLQLYNFGCTISIPFWDEFGSPESFFDKLMTNLSSGLHTLCLLDIKVKDQSLQNLLCGNKIYEPPRFMLCNQAAYQLTEIIRRRTSADSNEPKISINCLAIGLARVGSDTQRVVASTLAEMARGFGDTSAIDQALGGPLHSLIIPSKLHPIEEQFLMTRCHANTDVSADLPAIYIPGDVEPCREFKLAKQLFDCHHDLLSSSLSSLSTCST